MKRLLQVSVLMNIVLLLATGWRDTHQPPMVRTPRGEVGPPVGSRTAHHSTQLQPAAVQPATPWAAIESDDPQQFIVNLRALGCPEQTIRDIVALRICRGFHERFIGLRAAALRAWDFTRPRPDREWREDGRRRSELRDEMIYTLESVLGQSWPALCVSLLGWPEHEREPAGFLSVEKRRELRALDARYNELRFEVRSEETAGRLDTAAAAAKLRELDGQKQAEMARLLSPEELQEYRYRKSPAADYARTHLPEAKSESEFRKMVDVAGELQMAETSLMMAQRMGVEPGDPAVTKAETDRTAAFEQRLKEVLGEARIAEQQAEEEQRIVEEKKQREAENLQRELARFTETAAGVGIAESDAKRFFDRLKELEPVLEPEFTAMEKSLTGTDEEKHKQMDAFAKARLGKIAVEILGDKGTALIEALAARDGQH